MMISISVSHLASLLRDAARLGADQALTELDLKQPYMNKSTAIKKYGKANFEQWIAQGLVKPHRDGNDSAQYRINRAEIEAVASADNRAGYLTVEDRRFK
ncbi:MAG TPA: hypothetical protein VGB63_08605 [Pedobacter sp.]|jgi:hypothetical protein